MLPTTKTVILADDPKNPFDGVTPDPSAFGAVFNNIAVLILGGVWGLALIFIAILTVIQAVKWAAARSSHQSEDMTEAAGGFKRNLVVFGVTAGIGLIFAAILFVVTSAS